MKIKVLFAVLLFAIAYLYSSENAIVSINCQISETNGNPVNGVIKIIGNGKVEKPKVTNGNFTFSPRSGNSYKLYLPNYVMLDGSQEINIPAHSSYQDLEQKLQCRKLNENDVIFSEELFYPNTANPDVEADAKLKKLKEFLDNQPNLACNLIISAADCNIKPIKQKQTVVDGKKKKTVMMVIAAEDQAKQIIEERKKNLTTIMQVLGLRIASFNVIEDTKVSNTPATKAPKAKAGKKGQPATKQSIANVKFTIAKIRS